MAPSGVGWSTRVGVGGRVTVTVGATVLLTGAVAAGFRTATSAVEVSQPVGLMPKVGGNASGEKGCGVVRGAPVVGVGDLSTLAGVEVVVELANRMGADGKYVCDCAVCVLVTHS